MTNKILFFLRHYNDIDHIVPVIYKWLHTSQGQAHVIITTDREYLDDYRIKFLEQFDRLVLYYITDFFEDKQKARYESNARLTALLPHHPPRLWNKFREILFRYHRLPAYDKLYFDKLFCVIFGNDEKGVVVFDWLSVNSPHLGFVEKAIEAAKGRGLVTVSLPHGDSPHFNRMIRLKELDYSSMDHYASGSIFDYVVVPNDLCARRYLPFLEPDRIKVLGSPRYNNEWLSILDNLIDPFVNNKTEGKLKLVLFLRNYHYPIFWEEVIRTIQLIAQFEHVFLVVKHHTRDNKLEKFLNNYPDLKISQHTNVEIVFQEIHSGGLLKWADIIIDVGTSVAFEAVKMGKPVLALEYLHAGTSTVAHYIKASDLRCRDDLYDVISGFIDNPRIEFYNQEERDNFIRDIIEVQGENVLDHYSDFINGLFLS